MQCNRVYVDYSVNKKMLRINSRQMNIHYQSELKN
jgi:hypothetical protein